LWGVEFGHYSCEIVVSSVQEDRDGGLYVEGHLLDPDATESVFTRHYPLAQGEESEYQEHALAQLVAAFQNRGYPVAPSTPVNYTDDTSAAEMRALAFKSKWHDLLRQVERRTTDHRLATALHDALKSGPTRGAGIVE
jgi:hypothetical protein